MLPPGNDPQSVRVRGGEGVAPSVQTVLGLGESYPGDAGVLASGLSSDGRTLITGMGQLPSQISAALASAGVEGADAVLSVANPGGAIVRASRLNPQRPAVMGSGIAPLPAWQPGKPAGQGSTTAWPRSLATAAILR